MIQRTSKIVLSSNDKVSTDSTKVCDYTFNQMTMDEQDNYLQARMIVEVASTHGGIGTKMLKEITDLTDAMEAKYNHPKEETLFEMKRRILKQGLK